MPADQFDRLGIGLVQRRVVEDQDPVGAADQGPGLLPQRLGVGLGAVEQAAEGVVGRGVFAWRLHAGGLRTGDGAGAGDQVVDVVEFGAARGVHVGIIKASAPGATVL